MMGSSLSTLSVPCSGFTWMIVYQFSISLHHCLHHTSCLRWAMARACLKGLLAQNVKLIRRFYATSIILFPSSKALVHSICNIRDLQTLLINSRIPTPHTRINTPAPSPLHTLPTTVYHSTISHHTLSQSLAPTVTRLQRYITHQVPTARLYQGIFLPQVHTFCFPESDVFLTSFTRSTRSDGGCPHAAKTIPTISLPYSTIQFSGISRVITKP